MTWPARLVILLAWSAMVGVLVWKLNQTPAQWQPPEKVTCIATCLASAR